MLDLIFSGSVAVLLKSKLCNLSAGLNTISPWSLEVCVSLAHFRNPQKGLACFVFSWDLIRTDGSTFRQLIHAQRLSGNGHFLASSLGNHLSYLLDGQQTGKGGTFEDVGFNARHPSSSKHGQLKSRTKKCSTECFKLFLRGAFMFDAHRPLRLQCNLNGNGNHKTLLCCSFFISTSLLQLRNKHNSFPSLSFSAQMQQCCQLIS